MGNEYSVPPYFCIRRDIGWNRQGTVSKLGKEGFLCMMCKSVLKFLAMGCYACSMGIKVCWPWQGGWN